MKTVFFNFAPHLGDLLISRGLANALARDKGERSVTCTYLTDWDIYEYLQSPNFEIRYSPDKKDYDIPVVHNRMTLYKNYLDGTRFQYVYEPSEDFVREVEDTIERQIEDGIFDGITKTYNLHMQFNVVYLGYYLEKNYGIPAEGYRFEERDGKFYLNQDNVVYRNGIIPYMAGILGIEPIFTDFIIFPRMVYKKTNRVLLIPDSRHLVNLSNQYWDLAKSFFQSKGFEVNTARYGKDYSNIKELADIIRVHDIIVVNDSFPYHLAWTLEKNIILKEKFGVLSEWTHRDSLFHKRGRTYSIPPAPLYEEDYVYKLDEALCEFMT